MSTPSTLLRLLLTPSAAAIALIDTSASSLNLLRRRRALLGLGQPQDFDSRKLLVKGCKYSALIFASVALPCVAVPIANNLVRSQIDNLAPQLDMYNKYQSEILSNESAIKKLRQSTKTLALAMSGVRSGSALFSEVSRIIPRSIQLLTLTINESSLSLTATATANSGLESINAFQLLLEESPFFDFSKVNLISAVRRDANKNTFQSSPLLQSSEISNVDAVMNFEISANFSPNQANLTRPLLAQLGSIGLSKRMTILRSEGLLE